ncbi:MAG: PEP-CTERM sorting domain-containing protein [Phycisphaerae bacterium]
MFYRRFPLSFLICGLMLAGVLLLVPAAAVKAETIVVPADGSTVFSSTLLSGIEYKISVEGTYQFGESSLAIADAEWYYDPTDQLWYENWTTPDLPTFNQNVVINNMDFDWLGRSSIAEPFTVHTFSPDHVYMLPWTGQDEPLAFSIYDAFYGDNSGSLTVSITPEPASLSLLILGGLALLRRRK